MEIQTRQLDVRVACRRSSSSRYRCGNCHYIRGLLWWLSWWINCLQKKKKKRISLQCRRSRFNPWVAKTPWRREWQSSRWYLKPWAWRTSFSSIVQSCPTLCDPLNCSTPGLPVHRQLPEFTQTYVHGVGDAIQPSHPPVIPFSSCLQSFPASGSFWMSQFFTSGGQSIGVSASTSVLPMNIQEWFPLGWTGWISLQSKGLSRVFSNTTVQKH